MDLRGNADIIMNLHELLNDKSVKPKEKTETLSKLILENKISISELLTFAQSSKDPLKATCIESLEFATKKKPSIANHNVLKFVVQSLKAKAPRIKWESAKVISNIAFQFKDELESAIKNLLDNTEHEGTVVRWSAAMALAEIIKLKTKHNNELLPAIDAIIKREEKNSIKKIYIAALKH